VRVLVVGAGLAGLSAAARLRHAGIGVDLIEASERIGGRARTVRNRFVAGQYVESGAEWVDTDHRRIRSLMQRHGIDTLGEGQEWTMIRRMLFADGRLLDGDQAAALQPGLLDELDAYEAAFGMIAEGIADAAFPELHPSAAVHDARSMQDIADEIGLHGLSALLARRNSQGEFAEEPEAVSALFVGQQRAHMRDTGVDDVVLAHRVRGGVSGITECFAADVAGLLEHPIALGERLIALDWHDDGVRAQTTHRTFTADRVVLACSLVALRSVRFTPELPPLLARAIVELGYGAITKTALQYPVRTWPPGYASADLPSQRVYEPTAAQDGEVGVLMAYTGGDGGRRLAEHDEGERMRIVAEDVETMYGLGVAPLGGFSRAWSTIPRFGGAYAVYRPGQVMAFWRVLREPCGPLHLAGEHVATCTGYMEGALESGETVADRIVGGVG
jgi:monoamine oxidase